MSSGATWRVFVPRKIARALLRIPRRDRDRIEVALAGLAENPYTGDLKRLTTGDLRHRVGDYRIISSPDLARRTVVVLSIERRSSTTYRRR